MLKVKYKQDGMKSVAQSLYSRLPETAEMKFVRDVSELQSEVSQTNRVRLQNQPGWAAEPEPTGSGCRTRTEIHKPKHNAANLRHSAETGNQKFIWFHKTDLKVLFILCT